MHVRVYVSETQHHTTTRKLKCLQVFLPLVSPHLISANIISIALTSVALLLRPTTRLFTSSIVTLIPQHNSTTTQCQHRIVNTVK